MKKIISYTRNDWELNLDDEIKKWLIDKGYLEEQGEYSISFPKDFDLIIEIVER